MEILRLCLQSFKCFIGEYYDRIELIVVDNNSSDETKSIVDQFKKATPEISVQYVYEKEQGLSRARNKGAMVAKHEWLFYMDDDGLLKESTLTELFKTIENYSFDLFGGIYRALYLKPKPNWLPENFGNKQVTAFSIGPLLDDTIEGGIMVIKKTILIKLGMFNEEKGMIGSRLRYSEETEIVDKARMNGLNLGINPFFVIDHIVALHKYKIWYHLKFMFALGRDKSIMRKKLHFSAYRTILLLPFRVVKYFLFFLKKRDFYFQNFIWYSLNNSAYLLGYYYGKTLRK